MCTDQAGTDAKVVHMLDESLTGQSAVGRQKVREAQDELNLPGVVNDVERVFGSWRPVSFSEVEQFARRDCSLGLGRFQIVELAALRIFAQLLLGIEVKIEATHSELLRGDNGIQLRLFVSRQLHRKQIMVIAET